MLLQEGQGEIQRRHVQDAQTGLEEAMATDPKLNAFWLIWVTKTGDWLTVSPSKVNGTELGA